MVQRLDSYLQMSSDYVIRLASSVVPTLFEELIENNVWKEASKVTCGTE